MECQILLWNEPCLMECVLQVDIVCHGKTEVFPDKDSSDPYAVSMKLFNCAKYHSTYCGYFIEVLHFTVNFRLFIVLGLFYCCAVFISQRHWANDTKAGKIE